jgi:hypothetical protein
MLAARFLVEMIAKITGHRNLKKLARYDWVVILKVRTTHKILKNLYNEETGCMNNFEGFYNREMHEYTQNQIGEKESIDGH